MSINFKNGIFYETSFHFYVTFFMELVSSVYDPPYILKHLPIRRTLDTVSFCFPSVTFQSPRILSASNSLPLAPVPTYNAFLSVPDTFRAVIKVSKATHYILANISFFFFFFLFLFLLASRPPWFSLSLPFQGFLITHTDTR
jgi:hypothetical protein